MARTLGVLAIALAAACGGEGALPRCGSGADCAAGTVCERPVAGEKGVCVVALGAASDGGIGDAGPSDAGPQADGGPGDGGLPFFLYGLASTAVNGPPLPP